VDKVTLSPLVLRTTFQITPGGESFEGGKFSVGESDARPKRETATVARADQGGRHRRKDGRVEAESLRER
jgi:hypothetical protein